MLYIWGLGSYNGSFLPRPWWWCWGGRHPGDPFLSSLSDWFIGSLDYLRYNAWANWVPINIMVSLVSTRRLIPVSGRPSTLWDYLSPTAHCFGFFLGLGTERAHARWRLHARVIARCCTTILHWGLPQSTHLPAIDLIAIFLAPNWLFSQCCLSGLTSGVYFLLRYLDGKCFYGCFSDMLDSFWTMVLLYCGNIMLNPYPSLIFNCGILEVGDFDCLLWRCDSLSIEQTGFSITAPSPWEFCELLLKSYTGTSLYIYFN